LTEGGRWKTTLSVKEETRMGFVYEHITVEDRAAIGMVAALSRGVYGTVTAMARELGTSRKFVYGLAERVRAAVAGAVAPCSPGPRPPSRFLEVDRRAIERAIVTLAMAGGVSERGIAECLEGVYRVRPSVGYIDGVLSRASAQAESFNTALRMELPAAQVEADELFACGRAHLLAVEHSSLLILALRRPERCDKGAWREVLDGMVERGVALARLGSDGGKALGGAVGELAGVEHQLDLFHALRKVARVVRALEGAAYGAIAKEEKLARKASGVDPARLMGGYMHDRLREMRIESEMKIGRYEAMRTLGEWVAEALDAVEARTGRLRGRTECLLELRAATELMHETGIDSVRELAAYLDRSGPALLAYADQLALPMVRLARELGSEGVRMLSREWLLGKRLRHARGPRRTQARRELLRMRLLATLHFGADYPNSRRRVVRLLEDTMRGSSLAECINSLLRPYAQIMRGLGERFLPLFQLYRNAHVFARGKRAGRSPFQLAGIDTPEGNWLDWLGLGMERTPRRTPRALPQAA
jgi:hypothetical protein